MLREGGAFGRYRLDARIARGGMGEVWSATAHGPADFKKRVAIKTVLPGLDEKPSYVEMLIKEASLAARLNHPNIVQTFDLGCIEGIYYIAMEYLSGCTLASLLRRTYERNERIPLGVMLEVAIAACEGLAFAHAYADEDGHPLGLLHRDISPSNIMITGEGRVALLDFGVATAQASRYATNSGAIKGKFHYLAPERVRGQPGDRRSDIYSLGVVIYQCLTYRWPFRAENEYELLRQIAYDQAPPPRAHAPWLSEEIERIILKAMARDAEGRYPDAGSMAVDLRAHQREIDASGEGRDLAGYLAKVFPELAGGAAGLPPLAASDARLRAVPPAIPQPAPPAPMRAPTAPPFAPDARAPTAPPLVPTAPPFAPDARAPTAPPFAPDARAPTAPPFAPDARAPTVPPVGAPVVGAPVAVAPVSGSAPIGAALDPALEELGLEEVRPPGRAPQRRGRPTVPPPAPPRRRGPEVSFAPVMPAAVVAKSKDARPIEPRSAAPRPTEATPTEAKIDVKPPEPSVARAAASAADRVPRVARGSEGPFVAEPTPVGASETTDAVPEPVVPEAFDRQSVRVATAPPFVAGSVARGSGSHAPVPRGADIFPEPTRVVPVSGADVFGAYEGGARRRRRDTGPAFVSGRSDGQRGWPWSAGGSVDGLSVVRDRRDGEDTG